MILDEAVCLAPDHVVEQLQARDALNYHLKEVFHCANKCWKRYTSAGDVQNIAQHFMITKRVTYSAVKYWLSCYTGDHEVRGLIPGCYTFASQLVASYAHTHTLCIQYSLAA